MNNLVILPMLIPMLAGIILIFFRNRIPLQRYISFIALLATLGVTLVLVQQVSVSGIQTLYMGGWLPPYGITLVVDMFSALLVAATMLVSLACVTYAFRSIGAERERFFFYPFFLFLTAGVAGSFMTGDIFNLFVCFEVMLISSYALIMLGGTKIQLRESLKYVLVNIVSSILFVVAVAYLYASVGTLNMAHLSERVAEAGQGGLLTVISILFLIVFGMKAGLFLYFWLPGSYSAPPTAIAAIFSGLLTKVGIYAIFRIFTLIFYHEPGITHQLIAWLAAATIVLGTIGAIAYHDVRKILAYNIVAAVGFIVFGLAVSTTASLEGAVYYLIHDMVVKALLFLLGGTMIAIAGTSQLKKMGGLIRNHPFLGWMTFAAALALAGVPPMSGFFGKLLILQGGLGAGFYWISGISLLSSLLILYSIMKVFMGGFWGEQVLSREEEQAGTRGLLAPCALLLAVSVALGVGVEFFYPYVSQAVETLLDPSIYINAVMRG